MRAVASGHRPRIVEVDEGVRQYIIRRLLYAIPTLLGISVIVFAITRLSPGDPVRLYTFGALNVTEEDIQALREYYGLNQPIWLQYVNWITQVIHLDFVKSLQYNRPALPLLLERLPATLQLEGGRQALQEERQRWTVVLERLHEVEMDHLRDPVHVLEPDGLVEAVVLAEGLDVLLGHVERPERVKAHGIAG